MAEGTEPIRQDLDSIRDSMTEKMEQIESKVRGTVDETVTTVKRTFDVRQQVDQRPWVALGAAVLAGYVVGSMGGSEKPAYQYGEPMRYYQPETRRASTGNRDSTYAFQQGAMPAQPQQPGLMSGVMDQFGGELSTIATAAVSAAVTMLRDTISQSLPQFGQEYERVRQERNMAEGPSRANDLDSQEYEPVTGQHAESSIADYSYSAPRTGL